MKGPMQSIYLSGLLVGPIAQQIRAWNLDGKISEEDLDYALTADARALIDHSMGFVDWAPLEDVEGLVALVAEQIGGDTGLAEWAQDLVEGWQDQAGIEDLMRGARSLVDTPGFVVSQASELLVRDADWIYDGGRSAFEVRLRGIGEISSSLKVLLGALLARLAMASKGSDFDVRFDGIDDNNLRIFGEALFEDDPNQESRLHQAALIA
jgi:hypothetical protein